MIWLAQDFSSRLGRPWSSLEQVFGIQGEIYREPRGANRRTLRFTVGEHGYFLKLHWGVGWREILKNLFSLRMPVLGASNEWRAIQRLEQLDVETMRLAAYGQEGWNPARLRSFVVTEELIDTVSLEDYCRDWPARPPPVAVKWQLIGRVAEMTRRLHENGVNHRDFYICHFLLSVPWGGDPEKLHLYLIDLHRVQIRKSTPVRWLVKDVGSLYFSAMDIGLTRRDLLRFVRRYSGAPLREVLESRSAFWTKVEARAAALYRTRPKTPGS